MYEISWHFVHSFTNYSRLRGATFVFVLYHTIMHHHTRPWKRWPNWTNYDSNDCSSIVFSRLGPQRLLSVPKPQAVAPGKEIHIEWGSHRGNRASISKTWTFHITKRASKCWKIAIPSVSPSKATMLRNKYNFAQKMLVFIKNPETFQPM